MRGRELFILRFLVLRQSKTAEYLGYEGKLVVVGRYRG